MFGVCHQRPIGRAHRPAVAPHPHGGTSRGDERTGGMIRVESSWDHRTGTEGPCKSGQSRVVPMGDPAAQVLERVSKRDEKTGPRDLVFIGKRSEHVNGSALYRRYVKARDAVREQDGDCPALVFHDLRHTFGSLLASAGVPIVSIQSYMGHADIATTSIYLHFIPRAAAAAEITRALSRGSVVTVEWRGPRRRCHFRPLGLTGRRDLSRWPRLRAACGRPARCGAGGGSGRCRRRSCSGPRRGSRTPRATRSAV